MYQNINTNKDCPLVSVVVCTYNQQNYIRDALDSILAQETDFAFEIILSDDCSNDRTPQICQEYADKYPEIIRFYHNKTNKGLVLNYYDSIRLAKSKYIADLAGDDIWIDKNKLQKQVSIMEKDSSIVLCHAAWEKFTDYGEVFEPHAFFMPREAHISKANELTITLLNHNRSEYFVHLCTALYRQDAVLQIINQYPEFFLDKNLPCEDLQLISLLSIKGKIAYIPDKVLKYRVGHISVSSTENVRKEVQFILNVIRLSISIAKILNVDLSKIKHYIQHDIQYCLMQVFISQKYDIKETVLSVLNEFPEIRPLFKTQIMMCLTSNTLLWRFTNVIYKKIKSL